MSGLSERLHLFLVGALAACSPALALSPSEVFEKVAPSVWAVRALDAQERPFSYGSAVAIAPGRVVTACRVLAKAKAIQLRRENVLFEARLEHADVERDLCILSAGSFSAPPATIASLAGVKVGQRVFAIGNPERLATTLSEGLVSGLRTEEGKPVLQTTAPLAPGLSGGGLFDEEGRLLGIAFLGGARPLPGASFAAPAEWIAEVPERAKALLSGRSEPSVAARAAASSPGFPPVGASWRYSYRDRLYGGATRVFTVRVSAIEAPDVRESFAVENGSEAASAIDASSIRFTARRLTADVAVFELAPYFFATELAKSSAVPQRPASYPARGAWESGQAQIQPEDVTVPAGTFKAMRLVVEGRNTQTGAHAFATTDGHIPMRFRYTAWYAPEANRYVMIRHQTWNRYNTQIGDEVVELLEHKRN